MNSNTQNKITYIEKESVFYKSTTIVQMRLTS